MAGSQPLRRARPAAWTGARSWLSRHPSPGSTRACTASSATGPGDADLGITARTPIALVASDLPVLQRLSLIEALGAREESGSHRRDPYPHVRAPVREQRPPLRRQSPRTCLLGLFRHRDELRNRGTRRHWYQARGRDKGQAVDRKRHNAASVSPAVHEMPFWFSSSSSTQLPIVPTARTCSG